MPTFTSSLLPFFLSFHALLSVANAELVECSDCCKSEDDIGVTSFNSNITLDGPLTWSVSSAVKDDQEKKFKRYQRNFYLSTPPGLDLESTSYAGCGIFFYNVTAQFQLGDNFTDYNDYTCNTFMSQQCQQDIVQQARANINITLAPEENVLTTHDNVLGLCSSFAASFQNGSIPQSCAFSERQTKWEFTIGQRKYLPTYLLTHPFIPRVKSPRFPD